MIPEFIVAHRWVECKHFASRSGPEVCEFVMVLRTETVTQRPRTVPVGKNLRHIFPLGPGIATELRRDRLMRVDLVGRASVPFAILTAVAIDVMQTAA